jgi:D-glycero-alpha-D-manno-heptose 1-phosphate guanylyltransferase
VVLESNQLVRFQEKQAGLPTGLINGGVYWVDKSFIDLMPNKDKFSFEEEVLQVQVTHGELNGYIATGMFIDIGIPEDYERAQTIFAQ